MTTRFGGGPGGMGYCPPGYGPQGYGMGPTTSCPTCGTMGPMTGMTPFMGGMYPWMGTTPSMGGMTPWMGGMYPFMGGMGPWMGMTPYMGGMTPWMGYQGFGPYYTTTVPDDEQIRQMIYDSIDADPLVPYEADINVDVTGGLVTLTGTVPNKRIKHAVGDDAWWIPGVWDVNNQLEVAGRARAERPTEGAPTTRRRPTRPTGPS